MFQFEQDGKKLTRVRGEPFTLLCWRLETNKARNRGWRDRQHADQKTVQVWRSPIQKNKSRQSRSVQVGRRSCRRMTLGTNPRSPAVFTQRQVSFPFCWPLTISGRCNRALTCPYAHIPDRLAICPRFLRAACPNTADSCPLSHKPSAHNTPSCVHFQATSTCRNGSECVYPHVRVAKNAPVCEAFARGGWCDKPPGTCGELHAWECQEFREKGNCSRGRKCGLRHVLRAEKEKEVETYDSPMAQGSFEDNSDFVNLEVGSPPEVSEQESEDEVSSSETSSGESDEGSDDDAEEMLGVVV